MILQMIVLWSGAVGPAYAATAVFEPYRLSGQLYPVTLL